jgi:hypothetical protein
MPANIPSMHPTAKPVALVADAIKDCTERGHTVLDAFAGTGRRSLRPTIPAGWAARSSWTRVTSTSRSGAGIGSAQRRRFTRRPA